MSSPDTSASTSSVKHLQALYSIVVGISLSIAANNLVDKDDSGGVRFELDVVLPLCAYLCILIPFFHGALRHLDITYIEHSPRERRRGSLLADFVFLFLEGCFFIVLSALMPNVEYFAWGLVLLLAFDTIWGLVAHFAFIHHDAPKAEMSWAKINAATVVVFGAFLFFAGAWPPEDGVGSLLIRIGTLGILFARTVVDYALCWGFYYPEQPDR